MYVSDKTPGPLRLLIVDVTRNHCGFEHATTKRMAESIRQRGLDVTPGSPVLVTDALEYEDALLESDLAFNSLLLVAHGNPDVRMGDASTLIGPDGVTSWYDIADHSASLQEKFLMLCTCYGFCSDAIEAFTRRDPEVACLSVLGSRVPITAQEAELFFPAFLEQLRLSSIDFIDPNAIARVLERTNHLAARKMELSSDGLSK
jgi:hypothetical protein